LRKGLCISLVILSLLFLGAIIGFVVWGETPAQPMPEALKAVQSDSEVIVTYDQWLAFEPKSTEPTTGFIVYPGGRVDFRSYAPTAHQIAAQGYLVVILRMPLSLAVFDPNAAKEVIDAYPEIQRWIVGGHSLGGAMAARFTKSHPDEVEGLVLWAAYPVSGDDLSSSRIRVISISGFEDGITTTEDIDASRSLLPADTTWVSIAGGNHAQFGWYGDQEGDNPADITRADQQSQIIAATLALLESINK